MKQNISLPIFIYMTLRSCEFIRYARGFFCYFFFFWLKTFPYANHFNCLSISSQKEKISFNHKCTNVFHKIIFKILPKVYLPIYNKNGINILNK